MAYRHLDAGLQREVLIFAPVVVLVVNLEELGATFLSLGETLATVAIFFEAVVATWCLEENLGRVMDVVFVFATFEGASGAKGVVPMSYVAIYAVDPEVAPSLLFCSPHVGTPCGVGHEDYD
jgi:hypothetical protein